MVGLFLDLDLSENFCLPCLDPWFGKAWVQENKRVIYSFSTFLLNTGMFRTVLL